MKTGLMQIVLMKIGLMRKGLMKMDAVKVLSCYAKVKLNNS